MLLVNGITGDAIEESVKKKVDEEKLRMSGDNGAVVNIWLHGEERLDVLRENRMKYLFVDVGDTSWNGKLQTEEKEIVRFLEMIRIYEEETGHDFVLLPYSEINTYVYDITSKEFQNIFVEDYSRLEALGFDGIYIDIEPVRSSVVEDYLDLVSEVAGKSSFVGVYSGSLGEESDWDWSPGLFKSVSTRVDLIFVPGYDTGIESEEEYQEHIKNQIEAVSNLNLNSILLLGVPTHKSMPETIKNSLEVFSEDKKEFDGVAIFSEWTADGSEWEIFGEHF